MRHVIATMILALSGCTVAPAFKGTVLSEAACTESCSEKFAHCPQMFSAFPERGAIECPAARQQCLRACVKQQATVAPTVSAAPVGPAEQSRETKLRELKHLHDEGLVSDEVYIERQRAILTEP